MTEVKEKPKHWGIQCPKCLHKIFSNYTHDFKYCDCAYCFVDGGKQYLRFGWGNDKYPQEEWVVPEQVEAT